MKIKIIVIVLLVLNPLLSRTQVLNNKLHVYVGRVNGQFAGDKTFTNGTFRYPALFPNFASYKGLDVKVLYSLRNYIKAGMQVSSTVGSDWKFAGQPAYENAKLKLVNRSALFQFNTGFSEASGLRNRLSLMVEAGPGLGTAATSIERDHNSAPSYQTDHMKDYFLSLNGAIGLELNVNHYFGCYMNYALMRGKIKSTVYADDAIITRRLNVGIYARFLRDKRYYY
jgi:hypothetical protein